MGARIAPARIAWPPRGEHSCSREDIRATRGRAEAAARPAGAALWPAASTAQTMDAKVAPTKTLSPGAAWRRAAFERLEAARPRRKSRAQATRREVERASAYYALNEAIIPDGLVAARRKPAVSAPTPLLRRRERQKPRVPALAVQKAPPKPPPKQLWQPPSGNTPRPPPGASRKPRRGAPCYLFGADADAFLLSLEFLDVDVRRVLEITTELSKACTSWLAPAAEGLWRSLCVDGCDVAPDLSSSTPYKDAFRLSADLRDRGLVVEVGMGCIRAGAATGSPQYIPLYYDTVRSTLDLESEDGPASLPPPSVTRQAFVLQDPSLLRRLVTAARESIGLRSLKGVSVALIRPPACERQAFERAAARALDDCRRFRVVDPSLGGDVSIDVGLFRTTAATKRRWAHQRLAGAALTRFVQLNLEDADPYGLSSIARAEALKTTDEAASCVEVLMDPRRGGDALEAALGEEPDKLKGLVGLARSICTKDVASVSLAGGSSQLPGLRRALARALPPNWRLLPAAGDAATWRAVAAAAAARDIVWADPDVPSHVRT